MTHAAAWYPATVARVVDGDTFGTREGQTIRVLGLDSPERGACYGSQATAYAQRVLLGTRVQLLRDTIQPATDRYGRDLRHVRLPVGNYAVRAIRLGYGESYADTYPNMLAERYNRAERVAKATRRGLWSDCGSTGGSGPTRPAPGGNCDPNYAGYCVPKVTYDLDCSDIQHSVRVIGTDRHGFDADGDGIGCETYG